MNAELLDLIDRWKDLKVLVLGDVMLDCYLQGSADRLCQEAPVPVVAIQECQDFPGGAANTAANIRSLGATAWLVSVLGQDDAGRRLQNALNQRAVTHDFLITHPDRATLTKQRVVANSHLLLRLDQGSTTALAPELEQQVIDRLHQLFPHADAVIVSDYRYGILTPRIIQTLAELQAHYSRILTVDAKNLGAYRNVGVTAVKPNYSEAIQLLKLPKQTQARAAQIIPYGSELLDITGAAIVAVTLDAEGAILFEPGQPPYRTFAEPVPVHQTSGAGDTFLSALTLALAARANSTIAASLAAAATAIAVSQPGTTTCSATELQQSFSLSYSPTSLPPYSPLSHA